MRSKKTTSGRRLAALTGCLASMAGGGALLADGLDWFREPLYRLDLESGGLGAMLLLLAADCLRSLLSRPGRGAAAGGSTARLGSAAMGEAAPPRATMGGQR